MARPIRYCNVTGCEVRRKAHGYCAMHLYRWRRYGDPLYRKNQYGTKRYTDRKGYVWVWAPRHQLANSVGYVLEHRKVAWDAGLLTDRALVVHHVNHDKADNRLENLAVKVKSEHDADHVSDRPRNESGRFIPWSL